MVLILFVPLHPLSRKNLGDSEIKEFFERFT